jgi:hypothetical protein
MRAISIHNPWATLIATGKKTLEIRSWKTSYRGDLLIVSTQRKYADYPRGVALCIVRLADVREFVPADAGAAHIVFLPECFAWVLDDVRPIAPFPVKGQQGFYNVIYPAQTSGILPATPARKIESLPLFARGS